MKIYSLRREQLIKKPLSEVFAFFAKPENLACLTPPSLGFRILTPTPIIMKEGTVIDYNIRVMGFKWHWKSIISHYEPPYKFVDEQLKGPYKSWHHTHMFIEKPGGTLVIDEVRYAIINSPLDSIMHVLYIKKRLNEVFDYRMRKLKRKFS